MRLTNEQLGELGISRHYEGRRLVYEIPCQSCGRIIRTSQFSKSKTYLCNYCKGILKEKEKIEIDTCGTKHEIRFQKAIKNIEEQVLDFDKYSSAISTARKRIDKYASIPEAMVAIELLKNKFSIIPQQSIGKYKVDFVLPKQKIVLEVDGEVYHTNKENEAKRDLFIYKSLGFDWKIIHLPAKMVQNNIAKLKEEILS